MGRQLMVAGNWKMNKKLMEALTLASVIIQKAKKLSGTVEIVLAPPAPYLHTINSMCKDVPYVKVAAQDCHFEKNGAYTGEVSAEILESMGLAYVIIGHSERRKYFNEDHDLLAKKVSAALDAGIQVIFCCGEPLEVREVAAHEDFVKHQLEESLFQLSPTKMRQVVVAYEPVWAIGTGKTASPDQAQEMHAFIRGQIADKYNKEIADNCTILYGGSCKPSNASSLFAKEDVDGGLVGGAALDAESFIQIIDACTK
jgi:triosephosphate isomerase